MLVQNKRKISNPAAAPSLLWKTQLGCWLILASRSFLCIGAERAVLVLRALLSLLAQSLSQKEALHFWIPQQQLDLQLEQISIACSFLWFGQQWEVYGRLILLQEKAVVVLWPTAWNGLCVSKYEVTEKSLWKRPLNNQGRRVSWGFACVQMPRSSHSPAQPGIF